MMKVYVFGNPDVTEDRNAILAASYLKKKMPEIDFSILSISDEIIFDSDKPIIMDAVAGIDEVVVFDDIDKIILPPRLTAHDFDLGFQLKYLKKLGRIKRATIVGIPMKPEIDYLRIQSIFKKLVEQDIQGS